jgi:TetR/AcrR family transcriptional repressor of nem operon
MARSSCEDVAIHRTNVLAAAAEMFCHNAIERTSVADIMAAAGLTHGGFYAHFASKEHLAAEACDFAFQTVAEGRSGGQFRDLVDEMTRHSCPISCFAAAAAAPEHAGEFRKAYERGVKSIFEVFRDLANREDPAASQEQVQLVFHAIVGAAVLARALNDRTIVTTAKATALSAFGITRDHTFV